MDRSRADCGRWAARPSCEVDRRRARGGCSRHPKHAGSPELRDPQPIIHPAAAAPPRPLPQRHPAWNSVAQHSVLLRRHAAHAVSTCTPAPAESQKAAATSELPVHAGSAAARSTVTACAWTRAVSASRCAASASGGSARQRSSDAFRSSKPRYSPAWATGGVR